jgi:hypothetical protein
MVKFNNKENGNNGYTAEIGFDILTPNYEDAIPVIKDFIDFLGLECKRNLGRTLESVKIAYSELEQFVKYHKWNGSPIYTAESIHQGFANHEARIKALVDLYNEVKDTRVINYNDVGQLSAWMSFPAITNQSSKNSFAEGSSITVTDIELSVEDTLLFVVNEPYVINFALVSAETESGLIHINTENGAATVYEGEEIFKIKGSATFTLPEAAVGRYALVAYISTEDGIRSSDYTPVKYNQVSGSVTHSAGVVISTGKNESSELTITYSKGDEIEVTVGAAEEGAHSYESMKFALEEAAYAYGFAEEDAKLEVKLDGNWQQLTGNESQLEAGTYRLKFSVKNGAKTYSGYVYTSYSV